MLAEAAWAARAWVVRAQAAAAAVPRLAVRVEALAQAAQAAVPMLEEIRSPAMRAVPMGGKIRFRPTQAAPMVGAIRAHPTRAAPCGWAIRAAIAICPGPPRACAVYPLPCSPLPFCFGDCAPCGGFGTAGHPTGVKRRKHIATWHG